ncbi:MAG: peptide chain release factor N(5)-glutamine methyltransferase [Clostridia bacterium]|nr:peptide chain release factor N(5)-glutamine methyltransferase [Clostridia bacterium]
MKKEKLQRTYIGGQAVMEGVMLKGKTAYATAVRDPDGNIQIESKRITPPEKQSRFLRFPIVRGVVNFIQALVLGNKVLMRSADVAIEEDEQPSKAEKWLEEKKVDTNGVMNFFTTLIAILLAVAIFIFVPQKLTGWISRWVGWGETPKGQELLWFNLIEGGIRLIVFVAYMLLMTVSKTLRRVYMYHGAEHKTITCVERGMDLTVDNVRTCRRVHDRCGTTFLFIVMFISIIVFSFANYGVAEWLYVENVTVNNIIRIALKLLMLPFVAGISYEVLRLLAKSEAKILNVFKWPGLLLQRITTQEPTDDMIECAIAAFRTVEAMDADENIPEKMFAIGGKLTEILKNTKERLAKLGIDGEEAEWIFALKLGMAKSAVAGGEERILKRAQVQEIFAVVDERMTGRPLWYVIGDTDFYGYKIKVDERVLIPRRETEELALQVVMSASEGCDILDLCTGSGAIAIAVCKELEKNGVEATVTASDISDDALSLAKENAAANDANIKFIKSDLFSRIRSRYHIIVSNPPYIPTADIEGLDREVKDYEPHLALDGGADGLDYYRRIATEAPKCLTRGGMVILEVGDGQASDVAKLFKNAEYTMIIKDLAGKDRFVKAIF